jgi:ferredoxin
MDFDSIARVVAGRGLVLRGAFHPVEGDGVPPLADGPAGTLVLAGDLGGAMWAAFRASPELDGGPDPLDRWTRRVAGEIATEIGARALFPFGGPPHHPFQRWAARAEPLHVTPLGLLIHPQAGLWHAWRVAFALGARISLPARAAAPAPCPACAKPCLRACPVDAFTPHGYDARRCRAHVASPEGTVCREHGCRARRACPVGAGHAYGGEQQRFHMAAFLGAGRSGPVG